jgi:hypothetical protein
MLALGLALSAGLVLAGVAPVAAASPTKKPDPTTSNQMARPAWEKLKAQLNSSPNVTKTVSVAGGTRTFTYSTSTGMKAILREPTSGKMGGVSPNLSAGGCGWFQLCLYFSHNDQIYLYAGLGALEIGLIALIAPPAAVVAGAVVAIAEAYVSIHGLCPNNRTLQIEALPVPGWNLICV